jgi:single-stranded-DNA-specific exonuclease
MSAADAAAAQVFVERHDVPEILARVLAARGVRANTLQDALDPTIRRLMPDPSSLTGMDAAAARIADAIARRESVALFGDYDVDGACSVALLARVLRAFDMPVTIHIPDRIAEGYGPNVAAVDGLARAGATLLITLDCGTTSYEPLARARELGLDVLVVDHHLADATLPVALAIVNPNRHDDLSGLGYLCAAGVTFMVCVAVLRELRRREADVPIDLLSLVDVVALATVADVVPLVGLNRAFVARGLEATRRREQPGLRALQDVARIGGPVEPYHLGFLLGPRINAGGRIGDAALGARLLMTDDADEAGVIAAELDKLNRERQVVEQAAVAEAIAEADAAIGTGEGPSVIVTSNERWHPGVLGLVAARLKETFQRPAFALALGRSEAVGSGRSIAGVDLGRIVRKAVQDGVLLKGGGHAMAAGVTVARDRLAALRAYLDTHLSAVVAAARAERVLAIDAALTAGSVTPDLFATIARAGPFGAGQPEPVFAFPAHRIAYADEVGNGHVRMTLEAGDGARLKGVAFRSAANALGRALLGARGRAVHVAGMISRESWQGDERVELRVLDAAEHTI